MELVSSARFVLIILLLELEPFGKRELKVDVFSNAPQAKSS